MRIYLSFLALLGLVFLSRCNSCPTHNSINAKENHDVKNIKVEIFVSGLEVPWAFDFAKDDRLFITERPGRIRIVEAGKLKSPAYVLDDVYVASEAGLMGIALHPDFLQNHWLYICYTTKEPLAVRIKRLRETTEGIVDDKIILDGIPGGDIHVGCQLRFGPDKKLYVTTGDAAKRELAQKLDSLAGKTLRINDDGSIPNDNPFVNIASARGEIWSYGHRNAAGIDFQPRTGIMFQTEHGPSGFDGPGGGDEVNVVGRGQNFGWPIVHHQESKAGMVDPLLEYTPALAPAGASFYKSSHIKEWTDNFFFTCLRGEALMRVVLEGQKVIHQEKLFENRFGRLRYVLEGPRGEIFFSTSNRDGRGQPNKNDDRIMKISALH